MKKVLFIFDSEFKLNGTTMFFINLYHLLRKHVQIDVLVYCENASGFDEGLSSVVTSNGGSLTAIDLSSLKKDRRALKFFFKANQYDVYHINTSHLLRCSLILSAIKNKKKCIRISHSHTNGVSKSAFFNRFLKPLLQRYVYRQSNLLLACSDDAGNVKFGNRFFEKKGNVLNNAIDVEKFFVSDKDRKKNRIESGLDGMFVLGTVGRLSKEKNQALLLRLLNVLLKNDFLSGKIHLLLVGDGPEKRNLKELAKTLGLLERVTFIEKTQNTAHYLSLMDVFLFPSLYEGFGIAALEAQAAGLFVLASNGVSRRINVCNRCQFMAEKEGPDGWANFIMNNIALFGRKNCTKAIIDSGFDIKDNSVKLLSFYGCQ